MYYKKKKPSTKLMKLSKFLKVIIFCVIYKTEHRKIKRTKFVVRFLGSASAPKIVQWCSQSYLSKMFQNKADPS